MVFFFFCKTNCREDYDVIQIHFCVFQGGNDGEVERVWRRWVLGEGHGHMKGFEKREDLSFGFCFWGEGDW